MSASLDDLFDQPRSSKLRDLIKFAQENKLEVGSTTGGRHNRGSKHYSGNAIDIANSGNFSDEQVQQLSHAATGAGFKLRDERRRPQGQAVWGGPHLHFETDPQSLNDLFDTPTQKQPVTPQPAPNKFWGRVRSRMEQQQPKGGAGELHRLDDREAARVIAEQAATKAEVAKEYRARRGAYGAPTPTGALHLLANPVSSFTGLFRSDEENIKRETEERLRQQRVAADPEVTSIRREYGQMSAPKRSVVAPVIGRGGGGLLKVAGGVASAFGIAPNRLSEWANRRGEIIETASSLPPLQDEQEVQRGVPEKIATGVADLGVGLGQIILLKKATGLRFNQLLALEAAARNSEKPIDEQLSRAGEAYALGSALDRHLSRPVSAAISGLPTAAQTGYEVSQGRMSPLDAAIQAGIQTASGAILTTPKPKDSRPVMPETFTEQRQGRIEAEEAGRTQRYADIRRRVNEPLEDLFDESQVETQPDAPAQPETSQRIATTAEKPLPARPVINEDTKSRQWQHADFGLVTEAPNQRKAGKGRVKVLDEQGREHYIKRVDLTGRGNQRAIPVREPQAQTPPESQPASIPSPETAGSATVSSPVDAGQRQGAADLEVEAFAAENRDALKSHLKPIRQFWREIGFHEGGEAVVAATKQRVSILGEGVIPDRITVQFADGNISDLKPTELIPSPVSATSESTRTGSSPVVGEAGERTPPPPASPEPTVPERPETLDLQLRALTEGRRDAVLIPPGTAEPPRPRTYARVETPVGVFIVNPRKVSPATVQRKVANGTYGELLGHVADKPALGEPTAVVTAKQGDTEVQSSAVPPERAREQARTTQRQNPDAQVEVGGPELAQRVINERTSTTSARKAQMAEDRAELDLPELPEAQRKAWQRSLDNAKTRGLDRKADTLADEVLNQPRVLDDEETAGLVLRGQQLKNDHARVMDEIAKAETPEAIASKVAERDAIESALDKITRAAKLSGTEKGRTLAAQKLTVNEGYDLASVLVRAKAAKKRPLTEVERKTYEDLVAENVALEAKLTQAERAATSKTIQQEIDRAVRRRDRAVDRKALDEEAVAIRQRIAEAWMKVKRPDSTTQPSGLGRLDPLVEPILDYARNRVRAGVTDAAQLVDDIHTAVKDVAEISKRDIQQIISGYGLAPRGDRRTEAAKELARIRKELRELLSEEDIAAGKRSPRREGPTLREGVGRKEGPRLSEAPRQGPPSQEARRARLEARAAELEGQLASGNLTVTAPKPKPIPTEEVFRLERRINDAKRKIEERLASDGADTLTRWGRRMVNILGLYRAVETSFDLSWMLRQGKLGAARHPVLWSKAVVNQFKGLSNDRYFKAAREIESDPEFRYLNKFGLELPSVESTHIGRPTHTRAEEFQTEYAHRVPGLRQSEQVYNIGLDTLRVLWAKHDMNMLRKAGFNPDSPTDFKVFKEAMHQINDVTGRTNLERIVPGKLGKTLNTATPAINVLTYAARFWASRLKVLTAPLDPRMYPQLKATKRIYESMPRVQRVEAWKRLFAFYGLIGAQMMVMKGLGFEIETDPDKDDFGKLRRGKRVYDFSAGTLSHLRFAARMVKRVYEAKTGTKPKASGVDTLGQYLRTKESPVAGRVHDIFLSKPTKEGYGTDFKGDPVYPTGKPGTGFWNRLKTARLAPKPLGLEDAMEAYDQLGWGGVATTLPATTVGEGVQNYPQRTTRPRRVSGGFK